MTIEQANARDGEYAAQDWRRCAQKIYRHIVTCQCIPFVLH